ncbi:MAG: methylglyoxal synthase [Candidatus Zhuqueibacterota bacterium]
MKKQKNIALVAHDHRKQDLIEWVEWNFDCLVNHQIICTGTTGRLIEQLVQSKLAQNEMAAEIAPIVKLKSGPLGGDQQLGAKISEGAIDVLIFFWDPMQPQPHDVDVKALLRIATVYNIPVACNRASADFIISSPLFSEPYQQTINEYSEYVNRPLE